MSETKTSQATSQIEILRHASRGYDTKELKKIATMTTKQIKVLSELVLEFPANDSNKKNVAGLRSVRAAIIDVIVERLGEDAGDRFMDELGL